VSEGASFDFLCNTGQAQNAVSGLADLFGQKFGGMSTAVNSAMSNISSDFMKFAGAMTSAAGAVDYLVKGLKGFEAFEKLIVKTGGLLNATKGELKLLQDTAIDLGAATEYAAKDVAGAMSQMALAGFSVNEIVGALPGLLGMATAGMVGIGQATTIASEILRTFQIEAKNMDYVAGALTTTFTTTNTTLSTLSYTMKYVGAQASELGVGLSQVAAVAGVLGNIGVKGSMSGTGLRQFMEKLAAGLGGMSQKLAAGTKGLKSMGLSWKDVSDDAGNLNLVKAVEKIGAALDKMGAKASARIKILRDIFGVRASSQIAALISQGSEVLGAKDLEIAFGGAKQQLMGFLNQATRLDEGLHGMKLNAEEMAESFVVVGGVGRRNLSRLSDQMRELGLVGGAFNTQVGVMRERVQKVDGKIIRDNTFTPVQELTEGTLRAVDGLARLRAHINAMGTDAEKIKLIQEIFGADPAMQDRAIKAFTQGGAAMKDFANRMLAANSAMDIQKKVMDSTWGSLELLSGSFDTFQTVLGELVSPIVRVTALFLASAIDLLMAGNTIEGKWAEFLSNLGGLERFINKLVDAFNKFSAAGKAVVIILLSMATLSTVVAAVAAAKLLLITTGAALVSTFATLSAAAASLGAALSLPFILAAAPITYLTYQLLPALLETGRQVSEVFGAMGTIDMAPKISAMDIASAMPEKGLLAKVAVGVEYAVSGIYKVMEYIVIGLIEAAGLFFAWLQLKFAGLMAFTFDLISNFGEFVAQSISSLANVFVGIVNSIDRVTEALVAMLLRTLVGFSYLALEAFFGILISFVTGAVKTMWAAIRTFAVDLPAIFLNMFLSLQAKALSFLGTLLTLTITVFNKILMAVIDGSVFVLDAITKIVLVLATLPVSLPYIAIKASIAFIKAFLEKLQPGFDAIQGALSEMFENIKKALLKLASDIINAIIAPVKNFILGLGRAVASMSMTMISLPGLIYMVVGKIVDAVLNGIAGVGNSIYNFMTSLPDKIRRFIISIFSAIADFFSGAARAIGSFGVSLGITVSRVLGGIAKAVAGIIVGMPYMILRVIWAVVSGIATGFIILMTRAFDSVRSMLYRVGSTFIYQGIGQFITNLKTFFAEAVPNMIKDVKRELAEFYVKIVEAVAYVIYGLPSIIAGMIKSFVDNVLTFLLDAPAMVANFFIEAIENGVTMVTDLVGAILSFGTDEVGEKTYSAVGNLIERLIKTIVAFPDILLAEIDYQIARVSKKLDDAIEILMNINWDEVMQAFANIIDNVINKLVKIFDGLLGVFGDGAENGFIRLLGRLIMAVYRMFDAIIAKFPWGKLWALFGKVWDFFVNLGNAISRAIISSIARLFGYLSSGGLMKAFDFVIGKFLGLQRAFLDWSLDMKALVKSIFPDKGFAGVIRNVLLGVLNLMEAGAHILIRIMRPVQAWLENVFTEIQAVIDLFSDIFTVFDGLGVGIFDVFADPNLYGMLEQGFQAAFNRLAGFVPAPLVKAFETIMVALGAPVAAGGSVLNNIGGVIVNLFLTLTKVFGVFATVFKGLTDDVLNNVDGIVSWIEGAFTKIANAGKAGGLGGMAAAVAGLLREVFDTVSDKLNAAGIKVFDGILTVLEESGPMGQRVANLMRLVGPVAKPIFDMITGLFKWLGSSAMSPLTWFIENVGSAIKGISALGAGLVTYFGDSTAQDATGTTGFAEMMQTKFKEYFTDPIAESWAKFKATITEETEELGEWGFDMTNLKKQFADLKDWAASQMADVVLGIIEKIVKSLEKELGVSLGSEKIAAARKGLTGASEVADKFAPSVDKLGQVQGSAADKGIYLAGEATAKMAKAYDDKIKNTFGRDNVVSRGVGNVASVLAGGTSGQGWQKIYDGLMNAPQLEGQIMDAEMLAGQTLINERVTAHLRSRYKEMAAGTDIDFTTFAKLYSGASQAGSKGRGGLTIVDFMQKFVDDVKANKVTADGKAIGSQNMDGASVVVNNNGNTINTQVSGTSGEDVAAKTQSNIANTIEAETRLKGVNKDQKSTPPAKPSKGGIGTSPDFKPRRVVMPSA
jgi:TP901 family phage tail tape measure protein